MVLLGLSILIASVSFLCYKHPPATWNFLQWFQRPSIQAVAKKQDAPPTIVYDDPSPPPKEAMVEERKESAPEIVLEKAPISATQDLDRKAMPPPPPPLSKNPISPTTPRPFPTQSIPSFNLSSKDEDSSTPRAPSFPALNSAQRASGGSNYPQSLPSLSSPPQSSFPAHDSAQRASGGSNYPPRLGALPAAGIGLMAPPQRSPLPNRTPAGLVPPPTHSSIPAKPRKKVLLTPGHSPLDWARLSSSPTANLRGLPPSTPYIRVPPSLLKQKNGRKGKDAWTVMGGKVYNITPYAPYHPGGIPELMKAAGRDGTKLFGEVHPWVNWEGMLENCLVGIAVDEGSVGEESKLDEMD